MIPGAIVRFGSGFSGLMWMSLDYHGDSNGFGGGRRPIWSQAEIGDVLHVLPVAGVTSARLWLQQTGALGDLGIDPALGTGSRSPDLTPSEDNRSRTDAYPRTPACQPHRTVPGATSRPRGHQPSHGPPAVPGATSRPSQGPPLSSRSGVIHRFRTKCLLSRDCGTVCFWCVLSNLIDTSNKPLEMDIV